MLLVSTSYGQSPRFVAEWEPAWGTLIRWPLGIPSDLVVELAKDDSLYVLVESYYQRDQALASFNNWGVNTDYCRFIFAPTYSHWTRDWGPHYVFTNEGIGGIADPVFDGYPWVPGCNSDSNKILSPDKSNKGILGYEEDDAVNGILADSFNCPLISLPVYLTGGNVMVDGYSTAISTQQMLDENLPVGNEDFFRQLMQDSLGITNYIIVDNPEVYGIQHIDCYAKLLDEETILVKEVDEWNPEYDCCENLAEYLGNELNCWGEPYEIIRIYCGAYNGAEVAAYTNSLILNKKVLVPLFGISSDETALQTWVEAMPGYEVIGFEWEDWYYYDALHCRTKAIFDRGMLRLEHKPLKGQVAFVGDPKFKVRVLDYSQSGLVTSELRFYWRLSGTSTWDYTELAPVSGTDSLFGFIPYPVIGDTYDYYFAAADSSGRHTTLPITAPDNYYTFTIENISTGINDHTEEVLFVYPAVFSKKTNISFNNSQPPATVSIYNMAGTKIKEWACENLSGTTSPIVWDGTDESGKKCIKGMYLVQLKTTNSLNTVKCILLDN